MIESGTETLKLVEPTFVPPLDPGFRPAVLANRAFAEAVARSGAGVPLVLGLERLNGERLAVRDDGVRRRRIRMPPRTWSTRSGS